MSIIEDTFNQIYLPRELGQRDFKLSLPMMWAKAMSKRKLQWAATLLRNADALLRNVSCKGGEKENKKDGK